jgi:hypothetical protein
MITNLNIENAILIDSKTKIFRNGFHAGHVIPPQLKLQIITGRN